MKRASFAHGKAPMIVGVIKEKTVQNAILKIREGEVSGARGFDLHIPYLERDQQDTDSLRKIIASTDRPILSLHYDTANYTDEERMETLLRAVEAGTAAVDMQGYTFDRASKDAFVDDAYIPEELAFLRDKRPREVTLKPEALAKQKEFIDKVHAMGAEVLGSVHFGTILSREEMAAIARFVRAKGADVVKMVGVGTDKYQVPAAIDATIYLNEVLDFPFSYHLNGREGIPTRKLCPLFGSYVVFCNVDYSGAADQEQLHVRSIVDTYRALGVL